MGRSEVWDDIQPAMLSHPRSSTPTKRSVELPYRIVDILIDAAEENFKNK
jgi:hypothetical protein